MTHFVTVKVPSHIFSEEAQDLRDRITSFLEECCPGEDVDSYYSSSANPDPISEDRLHGYRYIHFMFEDPKAATLFKLAFG